MFNYLQEACRAAIERDPAARSAWEVLLCYPTVWALLLHQFSHFLWRKGWCVLARWLSQVMRWITGVEIHPGAVIGRGVFIDHGMGVVIGETSRVGDGVTIYHGVTLGGVMPAVDAERQRTLKRHPTLEEGVIVGSGAQILGDIVIGKDSRIGANAVVTKNVGAGEVMVGIPAQEMKRERSEEEKVFSAYGIVGDCEGEYDGRIKALECRVEELERRLGGISSETGGREERP